MDSTVIFLVGSNCFLLGALLAVFLMFGMNKVTFHVQTVEPVRRRDIKRFTGIQKGMIWQTIRPYCNDGYKVILWEETMGVGVEYVVLERVQ